MVRNDKFKTNRGKSKKGNMRDIRLKESRGCEEGVAMQEGVTKLSVSFCVFPLFY